jgi:hypothetical protein
MCFNQRYVLKHLTIVIELWHEVYHKSHLILVSWLVKVYQISHLIFVGWLVHISIQPVARWLQSPYRALWRRPDIWFFTFFSIRASGSRGLRVKNFIWAWTARVETDKESCDILQLRRLKFVTLQLFSFIPLSFHSITIAPAAYIAGHKTTNMQQLCYDTAMVNVASLEICDFAIFLHSSVFPFH